MKDADIFTAFKSKKHISSTLIVKTARLYDMVSKYHMLLAIVNQPIKAKRL